MIDYLFTSTQDIVLIVGIPALLVFGALVLYSDEYLGDHY